MCSVQCAVCSIQCSLWSVQYASYLTDQEVWTDPPGLPGQLLLLVVRVGVPVPAHQLVQHHGDLLGSHPAQAPEARAHTETG